MTAVLTFVTSIRARAVAADWDHHVRLLERTLRSCLAQTDPEVRVLVGCHDRPSVGIDDPRLEFLALDLPVPRHDHAEMVCDKVLKISAAAQKAIADGSRFIMFADADDLVSRRLAWFARQHPDANGWYFSEGYSHQYGRPWLTRTRHHHLLCGTAAVLRSDLLRFAHSDEYRGGLVNTLAAAGHHEYAAILGAQGHPLEALPFAGSVYIQHDGSLARLAHTTATVAPRRPALGRVRRAARDLAGLRPLTPALTREFTIERSTL